MSLPQEEHFIGKESSSVPTVEPDEYCNGKKVDRTDAGETVFTGYCRNPAGKGTGHLGEGRCKYHGGCSTGAPGGNQNRTTHALNADPENYYESLNPEQKEFIRDVSATIEDRVRENTGDVDHLDRRLAKRIAIELHIVSKASDYVINVSGLVDTITTEQAGKERKTALLEEVRKRDRTIVEMLRDLGVLDEPKLEKSVLLERWGEELNSDSQKSLNT